MVTPDAIISIGQGVIATEYEALHKLNESLDGNFAKAITLILETLSSSASGRLIISGMGKSGHVGRKIAATLASTGQPAFFVHPAESGHGDLGMITPGDVLILMSYSGESRELGHIIDYAKRFAIPIIAITGKAQSILACCATVPLILPSAQEACPMGLAPTSSSTMTLALGDAIAITLLTLRGFTHADFHVFHPSGSLGQQLKGIASIMHTAPHMPLTSQNTTMNQAIEIMTRIGFGCVGVEDDQGALVGIITDGDLRRHMGSDLLHKTCQEVMTHNPISLKPNALVADAIALFEEKAIACAFVVEDAKPQGLVTLLDCLRSYKN